MVIRQSLIDKTVDMCKVINNDNNNNNDNDNNDNNNDNNINDNNNDNKFIYSRLK